MEQVLRRKRLGCIIEIAFGKGNRAGAANEQRIAIGAAVSTKIVHRDRSSPVDFTRNY